MKLEELIYKRLSGSQELTRNLARFSGLPAVFSQEAPADNQEGWENKTQYPKIIYNFDLQVNEERKSAGVLSVSLLCQNSSEIIPEEIEPEVRKCLRDVILKPQGGSPYCFTWARTDAFTIEERKQDVTIGSEIRFDILEYPSQETTDPDPIAAMNRYVKDLYPEFLVIGYDRMEEITEASRDRPVIYCRLLAIDRVQETNMVAWLDGKIAVHILCPDGEIRLKISTAITNQLALDGEVIMPDYSPMFAKRLQVNHKSDYLKDGQIFFTGHYGLLRYKAKPHSLTAAHVKYK